MKADVLIDWFRFTYMGTKEPREVISDILGLNPDLFQSLPYGLFNYACSYRLDKISVNYNPPDTIRENAMFMSIDMSGSGCRFFEQAGSQLGGGSALMTLIKLVASNPDEFKCSRIDFACDDENDVLPFDIINYKLDIAKTREFRSVLKTTDVRSSRKGNVCPAKTFYVGSRSSEFSIRIYDKAKQMYHPTKEPELYNSCWKRVELEFKGSHAQQAIQECLKPDFIAGDFVAGVLNDKFAFVEPDDSNISRCSVCDWWQAFIESLEAVKLTVDKEFVHAVQKSYDWLYHRMSASIALVYNAMGFNAVQEIYMHGKTLFKGRHTALIDDYKNSLEALAV